ncbi:hypothetical protein [Chamaesiphon minutus]|nr:hypothetical protein [Chamaesiphon minutus]
MTDDSMRMASFRIDREMWAKFSAIAKRERLTATDALTGYIQRCIDNDKTEYGVNTSNDEAVSTGIDSNDKLTETIITAMGTMSLPTREDVMTMVKTAIDTSVSGEFETFRAELLEVSEFARNLQGEIVKVKKPFAIV